MKSFKIGRDSGNDIVISDVTVSSQHAIITLSDSGEVKVKDLNSTNGTFVNGNRISAETAIKAGDVVKMGNSTVDWLKHINEKKSGQPPLNNDLSSLRIKSKKAIGRSPANDIVLNYQDVSSSHAQLVETVNGEMVIADTGSTNGTYVNGQKINMHTLRPGDTILIANKYPVQWGFVSAGPAPKNVSAPAPAPVSAPAPAPASSNNTTMILIVAASIVVIAIAAAALFVLKPWEAKPWPEEQIYATYKKSVVMIFGKYYYQVNVGNQNLGNFIVVDDELVPNETNRFFGTGFFVSNNGEIITNKHIAAPWAYNSEEMDLVKKLVQEYMKYKMHITDYATLVNEVKVTGRLASIGIAPNDTHLSGERDIIPCEVLKVSDNNEIDLALIQTNSKTLPAGVTTIVDLNEADVDDTNIVAGRSIYSIGFPAGLTVSGTSQGIEANNQGGKITQLRGDVSFGHNITVTSGASGSPVFDEYGRLVGVIDSGFMGISQGYNMAIKAKYVVGLVK